MVEIELKMMALKVFGHYDFSLQGYLFQINNFVTKIEFLFGNRMELLVFYFVTRKELLVCN